jgi:hypothetical protein
MHIWECENIGKVRTARRNHELSTRLRRAEGAEKVVEQDGTEENPKAKAGPSELGMTTLAGVQS